MEIKKYITWSNFFNIVFYLSLVWLIIFYLPNKAAEKVKVEKFAAFVIGYGAGAQNGELDLIPIARIYGRVLEIDSSKIEEYLDILYEK